MQRSLGLVDDLSASTGAFRLTHHLVRPANEDGDSASVGEVLDDEHLVLGRAKGLCAST